MGPGQWPLSHWQPGSAVFEGCVSCDLPRDTGDRKQQVIVAYADLSAENVAQQLKELAVLHAVRGIRQILNWEPTWPKVPHGQVLADAAFQAGYAKLADHNLSFDLHVCFLDRTIMCSKDVLQINPHQMQDAAALARKVCRQM